MEANVQTGSIRAVTPADAPLITEMYNWYIKNSVITFETTLLTVDEMRERIDELSAHFPYFVYEIGGKIAGFCYAHPWKQRAAYSKTLETTIYLSHDHFRCGIGRQLMSRLIDECRSLGYNALIACITGSNSGSIYFHRSLGFHQVSFFEKVGYKLGQTLDVTDYELLL